MTIWHIRDQLFGHLDHKTLENCRQVSDFWDESLEKLSLVKFIYEFAYRRFQRKPLKGKIVSDIILGWTEAARKYEIKANIEDLREIKDSLQTLLHENGKRCKTDYPVHEAARNGDLKLMEFLLCTSYDMNSFDYGPRDWNERTAFHYACENGKTEVARLIIQSAKEHGIDLNDTDGYGRTAFIIACENAHMGVAELIINSSKEQGIDINGRKIFRHHTCQRGGVRLG